MFLFMHCVSSHEMLCDLGFVWAMIKISCMLKENRVKSSELFDCETYRRQKRVDVKLRKKYTNLKFCGTSLARTLHQHSRTYNTNAICKHKSSAIGISGVWSRLLSSHLQSPLKQAVCACSKQKPKTSWLHVYEICYV